VLDFERVYVDGRKRAWCERAGLLACVRYRRRRASTSVDGTRVDGRRRARCEWAFRVEMCMGMGTKICRRGNPMGMEHKYAKNGNGNGKSIHGMQSIKMLQRHISLL